VAERLLDAPEVLVAAKKLIGFPGIDNIEEPEPVKYFHILMRQHEIIRADDAWVESLLIADQSKSWIEKHGEKGNPLPRGWQAMGQEPARPIVKGKELKKLLARIAKNNKPLQEPAEADQFQDLPLVSNQ
jgi:hypothetical protein